MCSSFDSSESKVCAIFGSRRKLSLPNKYIAAWVDVIGCLFAILLGYVFFVRFVRKQGLRYFRVQTEIELAEQIHRSLVPPIARHASQHEFYGVSAPSGEMGGDLVDLVQDGDKWIGYLAD